jgi:hypothetical protein
MAEQKQPDISFAGGLAGINPAELAPEDIQKLRDTTEEGIKALEHRYDKPNWFKVSAGFAKPQLGGFLASLGSAAEAMGENVEQERANVLPTVQAKILRDQANMMLSQKIKQNDLFQQWKASGMPMDEQTYTRIASLGNDTEVAKSAKQYWDQASKRIETAGTAEELSSKYPRLDSAFKNFVDVAADPHSDPDSPKVIEKRAQYEKDLNAAKPPQTDAATWASMSREAKQDAIYKYQESQQKAGLTKEGEFKLMHDQAMPRLATMGSIRDLALGKGLKEATVKDENGKEVKLNGQQQMAKLLGMFGGDNPFEIIAKAANEGRFGDIFKGADSLVRQGMMTPEARREFEILTKLLAQQNVQLRNGAVNPTNAYQEIQTAATPGTFNSQGALVSILDLMAHGEKNNIDNYQYILTKHPDARHIGADPEFYKRQSEYANRHHEIALGKPSFDRPDFYNPYPQQTQERQQEAAPQQSNAPQAAPAAPAAPARRSSLADEILRRRNQNRGQQ